MQANALLIGVPTLQRSLLSLRAQHQYFLNQLRADSATALVLASQPSQPVPPFISIILNIITTTIITTSIIFMAIIVVIVVIVI